MLENKLVLNKVVPDPMFIRFSTGKDLAGTFFRLTIKAVLSENPDYPGS